MSESLASLKGLRSLEGLIGAILFNYTVGMWKWQIEFSERARAVDSYQLSVSSKQLSVSSKQLSVIRCSVYVFEVIRDGEIEGTFALFFG